VFGDLVHDPLQAVEIADVDAPGAGVTVTAEVMGAKMGEKLVIQKAQVANKGVRFRVRLPADSLQEATQICASIKAGGGDCFATNG